MKIKEEYILQNIADQWLVIDTNGKSVNFNKILALNESGRYLWEQMEKETSREQLIPALMTQFDIDETIAQKDTDEFIRKLRELECLEDEQ